MPASTRGEVLVTRNRQPAGEGSPDWITSPVPGHSQKTSGRQFMVTDAHHAERMAVRRITLRNVQNRSVRIRAVLAPIESRMGVEDLQTAHEHEEYTQCVYPMQHASRNRVSIDAFGATHRLRYARSQRSIQSPGVAILPRPSVISTVSILSYRHISWTSPIGGTWSMQNADRFHRATV